MIAFLLFNVFAAVSAGVPTEDYKCSLCIASVDRSIEFKDQSTFKSSCKSAFPLDHANYCSVLTDSPISVIKGDSRKTCEAASFCSTDPEAWKSMKIATDYGLDIKVSKAMGGRGYDKLRVSVISNHSIASDIFSYSEPFKYRWNSNSLIGDLYLNTGIISVDAGKKSTLTIEGQSVDFFIPVENDGTRGIILADPCFTSDYIVCVYKDKFNTFDRLTNLLNVMTTFDDVHFYQILGDNFYDQIGDATASWHAALSVSTKSRISATVPGNHDFWVHGAPDLWMQKDQQGNGFMQYYGQDVAASISAFPYDFSNDPDGANKGRNNLPPASDFFFYNKVGNIAMIGFSGAHPYESQVSMFDEACSWAQEANPAVVLLLTHWNSDGMGCDSASTAPAVYKALASRPACAPIADKMKYFMGHSHCNVVTETDVGFMIGALGMSDSQCAGQFGFSVVDSTESAFKIYYFPVQEVNNFDNYDAIVECVKSKGGVSNCYDMATLWHFKQL